MIKENKRRNKYKKKVWSALVWNFLSRFTFFFFGTFFFGKFNIKGFFWWAFYKLGA